jgi:hypothetical protein
MHVNDPNITIYVVGSVSIFVGIVIFIMHIIDKNHHKNPCTPITFKLSLILDNLLLMGIIIVDEIMVIYIIFSVMTLSK